MKSGKNVGKNAGELGLGFRSGWGSGVGWGARVCLLPSPPA